MNVKLLRAVKRAILEEPRRINMREGCKLVRGKNSPACGTVGCIAGWAMLLDRRKHASESLRTAAKRVPASWDDMEAPSQALLNLPNDKWERLVYIWNWPDDLKEAYYACEERPGGPYSSVDPAKAKKAAQITARRIERFIRTGGAQ